MLPRQTTDKHVTVAINRTTSGGTIHRHGSKPVRPACLAVTWLSLRTLAGRHTLAERCTILSKTELSFLSTKTIHRMAGPSNSTRRYGSRAAIAFSLLLATQSLLTTEAHAQCAFDWQPGSGTNGPQGSVFTMARTANGDLIAGGFFAVADNAIVNNVARYNGTEWQAIGDGVAGQVVATAILQNGDLVVAGFITAAGGTPVTNIARWNGNNWSGLGGGLNGGVDQLAVLPNGDLIAAGGFSVAGGQAAVRIARWDGATWSAMGSGTGLINNDSITVAANGDLFAGGLAVPGSPDIVRWNGTAWVALPGLATNALVNVRKIIAMSNNDIVIRAGLVGPTSQQVGIWNGSQLIPLPAAPTSILAFAEAANGDLLAASGSLPSVVWRFDGTSWLSLGTGGPNAIRTIVVAPNGDVSVGGLQTPTAAAVARNQAGNWQGLAGPSAPKIHAVERLQNGDVVVGGEFASIGGVAAANIARWNGTTYVPLGLGVDGPVTGLGLRHDGTLLVGGDFGAAGGAPALRIASWNGFAWSTLGAGLDVATIRYAQTTSGDILALATLPTLRKFDGQTWTTLSGPLGNTSDLVTMPDGRVIAIGAFIDLGQISPLASAYLYSNGSFTRLLESNNTAGLAATVSPSGDLVIAGSANNAQQIFTLTGQGPQTIGTWPYDGSTRAVQFLPNGDLLAAGVLTAVGSANGAGVARFDGTNWFELAGGLQSGTVTDLAFSDHGELFAAGGFSIAGGHVSANIARATTNCPASVVAFGAGCTGAGGTMQLTPESQPWLGSVLSATATGFPQLALGAHIIGLPVFPTALPFASPGCTLQVLPVQFDLLVPSAGSVTTSFLIPNSQALVGRAFRTQVIGIELDSSGNLMRLTSTNALQMTVGAF